MVYQSLPAESDVAPVDAAAQKLEGKIESQEINGKVFVGWTQDWFSKDGQMIPSETHAQAAVRVLLRYIGEDPNRDGLRDTPKRVLKALSEMTSGMIEDPAKILERQFALEHDELILLKEIPFTSLCEHHLLPFSGTAAVAYVPQGGVIVGLSKLARLVQCFARRPQVQERMTGEVADSLVKHLQPIGAACIISAEHSCMACRGARLPGAKFVTSALRGALKEDPRARAELISLMGLK